MISLDESRRIVGQGQQSNTAPRRRSQPAPARLPGKLSVYAALSRRGLEGPRGEETRLVRWGRNPSDGTNLPWGNGFLLGWELHFPFSEIFWESRGFRVGMLLRAHPGEHQQN